MTMEEAIRKRFKRFEPFLKYMDAQYQDSEESILENMLGEIRALIDLAEKRKVDEVSDILNGKYDYSLCGCEILGTDERKGKHTELCIMASVNYRYRQNSLQTGDNEKEV